MASCVWGEGPWAPVVALASWVYVGENFGWFVENGQGGDIGQVLEGCSARGLIKKFRYRSD